MAGGNGKSNRSDHGRQVGQFINKVTNGVKKREMKVPISKAREPKPEQVIPLEGGDFKEF